jgi:hypothetical protein
MIRLQGFSFRRWPRHRWVVSLTGINFLFSFKLPHTLKSRVPLYCEPETRARRLHSTMSSDFVAELMKIPPVTRFLCATQLAVSLPVMLQLVSPMHVMLIWKYVIRRYEVSSRSTEWGRGQTLIIRVRYGESSPVSSLEVGQSSIQNRICGIESFTPYTIGSGINFIFDFVML